NLTDVNGTLFFTAFRPDTGTELWKSDGTEGGTVLVKDINPGSGSASPSELLNVNGTLFFRAFHPDVGSELWKSDGTADGTVRVADINPGPASSGPSALTTVNGTLFFRSFRSSAGYDLWKSDGTAAGTVLVKGFGVTPPTPLIVVNGILFLNAGSGLWRSDGTEAGTTLIRDGILPPPFGTAGCGGGFAAVNGILVFPGRDGNGCELWRSDGVTADLLMDINPGPSNSMWPFYTSPFVEVGGLVLFGADDGVHGLELWATDGTSTTRLVQDIAEGAGWSTPRLFTPVGPLVYFTADDHISGVELWAIPR